MKFITEMNLNMREARWNGLCVVLIWVCVHFGCAQVLCMKGALIYFERVGDGTAGECQERKEFGKKGKEGKSGLRERSIFFILCDCVFHSILSPFHSTTPPLFFPRSHSHITSHHTTSSRTQQSHKQTCVQSFFLCVWLSVHSFHTQSNKTTPCNHAITTHGTTNGWCNERMGNSSGDWGHHTTNTKHHNEVMMALTSLGLIGCMDWACTLITTPQGQEWGEVTRRKRWLEKEG